MGVRFNARLWFNTNIILQLLLLKLFQTAVFKIILENHELCKYAKMYHIHKIVDLNQNIALNLHMFTALLRQCAFLPSGYTFFK